MTKQAAASKPEKQARTNVLEGSITRHVLRMMGPFSLAVLAMISTGIVDTIYLGRLTDDARPDLAIWALAALTYAWPLTFIGNSANIGLGAGTMSAVSRALGQGETERAKRHGAAAILLGLTVMTLLVSTMMIIAPKILHMAGARGDVHGMAVSYLLISLPGLVIVSVSSMSNNILRAGGEAALPSSIMIMASIINVILDPFLIFGWGPFPRLEVQGAALATLIGNIIGASFGFYVIFFHRKAVSFAEMTVGSIKNAWRIIGQVGIPAAGTNIVVPVAAFVAVSILGLTLNEAEVAAFGVASRAELLSIGVIYGLSACIGAITGRNGGAGKTERVSQTFRVCFLICFIWCSFMAIIMGVFAQQFALLFTNDAALIEKIIPYFYIVPITLTGYGLVFVSAAGLNAIGHPLYGLTYTIIRSAILYIGFIFIGVHLAGLTGAYYGVAGANIISGMIAFVWTLKRAPMTARKS